ncbi:50S ribosomal protein L32 [Amycolatopsis antarctica]|uniref:Large ribosomal subunit protein bL32 n=1 Tax=Amycolatopsis antarctica TaxID=1854586 RepID=A0A263D465_9PSEU|nr:50S ribosomal protein L32 [Amycolatopsis antarctica]OZM72417.1 50S ribosomal protein L32 [Amycolatopsis antarctica]
MAVPKRKLSRSNTRSRRARWKAAVPDLVPVTVDGTRRLVPRRLVAYYQRFGR